MQKSLSYVTDTAGNAIANATIQVNTAAGVPATIYSDDGVTVRANPILSDIDGSYWFYAADGLYNLVITKANYSFDATDTAGLQLFDGTQAVVGPAGPAGPTGATGPAGATGATGPSGAGANLISPDSTVWTLSVSDAGILSLTGAAPVTSGTASLPLILSMT